MKRTLFSSLKTSNFSFIFRSFSFKNLQKLSENSNFISNLSQIGLNPKILQEISSNSQLSSIFSSIYNINSSTNLTKSQAILLYNLSKKMPLSSQQEFERFSCYILQGKIKENTHLEKVLQNYKGNLQNDGSIFDWLSFEQQSGLNCEYTKENVEIFIKAILQKNKEKILTLNDKNLRAALFCNLLRDIRNGLVGADSQMIFVIFNEKIKEIDTLKTIDNEAGKNLEKEEKSGKNNKEKTGKNDEKSKKYLDEKSEKVFDHSSEKITHDEINSCKNSNQIHLWDKLQDLPSARALLSCCNTPSNFAKHLQVTNGRIFLRFPPEPNGFLHIGHAKAIRANFNSALQLNGLCNLRYDDTNPEKESQEFIENIEKNIIWLGYKPDKITYASDYFEQIHQFAIDLIKKGKAYVCEQSKIELQAFRKAKKPSPFRDRSIEENLLIFSQMKNGNFPEGSYCLRLKIDPENVNPTLRDPVIYRIKQHPHPKTLTQWNIYPTYDFTHCISDSLENISHSLCTLEFEIRRDLYYWILDSLEIFKPVVWEYSRLNISHNILSKRKLSVLVKEKKVDGWDDPRLLTLEGLKRRGYTPSSINEFCDLYNVTRRGNENIIDIKLLEHCLRKELDKKADRTMCVLEPIRLVVENFEENEARSFIIPKHPKDLNKGNREIFLTKKIFIEKKDVRIKDEVGFFGLAINKIICLKYVGFIECIDIKEENGEIIEIKARYIGENYKEKSKGVIHWISEKYSRDCEIRLFEHLFKVEDPNSLEDFKEGLNEKSKIVMKGCKIHKDFEGNECENYQFERIGYFILDKDSKGKEYVFNMSVGLKEKHKSNKSLI